VFKEFQRGQYFVVAGFQSIHDVLFGEPTLYQRSEGCIFLDSRRDALAIAS